MGVEARCDCLSKSVKESIMKSNLSDDIKDEFMRARTCGEISNSDVILIIRQSGLHGSLNEVIPAMRKYGLTHSEISDKLLEMRNDGEIDLEHGSPIGLTGADLEAVTILTSRARYAYAKVRKGR
jgi:hypothetical protein